MAGRIPYNAFMAAFGGGDQPGQTAVSGRGRREGGEPGRGFGGEEDFGLDYVQVVRGRLKV